METIKLIREKNGQHYYQESQLTDNPEQLRGLLNPLRWNILKLLAEQPRYPAEIAKELDVHEQKIYYHIRQLKQNNLIKLTSQEIRGGSVAKYYQPTAHAYTLSLPHAEHTLAEQPIDTPDKNLRTFLSPFITNGKIDCRIVTSSPDPHGPHQVRGRDSHLAIELAALLGRHGTLQHSISSLDVDIKNEKAYNNNLILLGGPLTNVITADINNHLPVRFEQQKFPYRELISEQTGKTYGEDTIGVIDKIRNPHNPEKFIILLAGIRSTGTQSVILALTQHTDTILKDYEGEDKWGRVIQGRDMDGDGKVDDIEILE